MAAIIRIKRTETSGNPASLASGELAYSALPDNGSNGGDRLYIGMGTETDENAVNHVVIGGKYFTDAITAATNLNTFSTLVKRDSSGNFAANQITAALLGNATTASAWATSRDLSLTGDATATLASVDGSSAVSGALTLATVNSTVGSFGSGTSVPVITVNAKGLVTSVTTSPIASSTLNILGNSGTDAVTLSTDSLSFIGSTGVTTAVTNNTVTFSIGQSVGTTDNVTFNDVTVNGNLYSNDITSSSINVTGDAIITGNLTVQGTTTTVNSTAVAISDINLLLAKDATTAAAANGAGITVAGPTTPASITYSSANDSWNFNKEVYVSVVNGALAGNATTASSLQTTRSISVTGDATWTTNFDGLANVTAALTLATVNATVGSFGSSTSVPSVTVNAKGLVTAVSSTAIPLATTSVFGLAAFDTTDFIVTSGVITLRPLDGGSY